MLAAMQAMLARCDEKIAESEGKPVNEVALEQLRGYRMALVDMIETYQKLEKQNAETTA